MSLAVGIREDACVPRLWPKGISVDTVIGSVERAFQAAGNVQGCTARIRDPSEWDRN